jgi:hypothetical protein
VRCRASKQSALSPLPVTIKTEIRCAHMLHVLPGLLLHIHMGTFASHMLHCCRQIDIASTCHLRAQLVDRARMQYTPRHTPVPGFTPPGTALAVETTVKAAFLRRTLWASKCV